MLVRAFTKKARVHQAVQPTPDPHHPQKQVFRAGSAALAGDFLGSMAASTPVCDGDVTVNLADLNQVLANFGSNTLHGDANGDGVVDLADLNILLVNFGFTCGR